MNVANSNEIDAPYIIKNLYDYLTNNSNKYNITCWYGDHDRRNSTVQIKLFKLHLNFARYIGLYILLVVYFTYKR